MNKPPIQLDKDVACKSTLSRRSLLKTLGATSIVGLFNPSELFSFYDYRSSALPPTSNSFNWTILGQASAYEMIDQKEQSDRTIRALGFIAQQKLLVDTGQKSVTQAANDIRRVLETEQYFNPGTFGELTKALQGNSDAAAFYSLTGNVLLGGTFAGLGAVFTNPFAAAALAATGIVYQGAFNQLSQGIVSSLVSPPSDEMVFGLTSWATRQLYEYKETGPNGHRIAVELFRTNHLPVDPNRPANTAVGSLPPSLQKIANSTTVTPQAMETAIRDEIAKGVKRLDKRIEELQSALKKERDSMVQAMEEARARREVEFIAAELNGLGVLGNLLLGVFGGNPDLGRKFQGFVQNGVAAYVALATPGLGPLAVASTLATSAFNIIGLFGTSTDPLMSELQAINARLDYVINRLDVISQQQIEILKGLQNVYQALQQNQQLLTTIQQQLNDLANTTVEGLAANERVFFANASNDLYTLITTYTPEQIATNVTLKDRYRQDITSCYTFATDTARSPNHAANLGGSVSDDQLRNTIIQRPRADRLIGLLPLIASRLGVVLPTIPEDPGYRPACPTAWAEGVNVFLEGRTRASSVNIAETELASKLWLDGQYLKEIIRLLTTPEGLRSARKNLRVAAGLPEESNPVGSFSETDLNNNPSLVGLIFRTSREFDTANIQRDITASYPGRYVGQYSGPGPSTVNFQVDYFQRLIDNGIIVRENCQPWPGANAGYLSCDFRIVADGPKKGQLLVPEKIIDGPTRYWPGPPNANHPANQVFNPWELQRRSAELFVYRAGRQRIQEGLPNVLRQALHAAANASSFPAFAVWGEILRLLGTLVKWRSSRIQSTEDMVLATSTGPYSLSEVATALEQYILKDLSNSGPWPVEITWALSYKIDSALQTLQGLSAAIREDKSVPIVDEPLRRLGAYMVSKNIPLRKLTVP